MAKAEKPSEPASGGHAKVKIALGAAGLFLFIIGVKRTFREPAAGTPGNGEKGTTAAGKPSASTPSARAAR